MVEEDPDHLNHLNSLAQKQEEVVGVVEQTLLLVVVVVEGQLMVHREVEAEEAHSLLSLGLVEAV